MPRQIKQYKNPATQALHEAKLKRRRDKAAEQRAINSVSKGGEGAAEFAEMVEIETRKYNKGAAGTKNGGKASPKTITAARENLTEAFDLMGGVPALVAWGKLFPTEFYRLWARLIPKESVEVSASLPLEDLLAKLASKEELSVAQAAFEVGTEVLEAARVQVAREDAMGERPDDDMLN